MSSGNATRRRCRRRWLGLGLVLAAWLLPAAGAGAVTTTTGKSLPTNGASTGIAVSGKTALVGEDPTQIGQSGPPSVAVFARGNNRWTPVGTLAPPAGANLSSWGTDVALDTSGATPTAVVGGDGTEVDVYVLSAGAWVLQQQIPAPADSLTDNSDFGGGFYRISALQVAISGDTLAVGGPADGISTSCCTPLGAVWVFTRAGGRWTETRKLTTAQGVEFGAAVALNGNVLLAGAPFTDPDGAAYVFADTGGGWSRQATLLDSTGPACAYTTVQTFRLPPGVGASTACEFGASVALSGNTAVIGEPDAVYDRSCVSACNYGRVWVFNEVGSPAVWQPQTPPLNASQFPTVGQGMGAEVAMAGNQIVASSGFQGNTPTYVFTNSNGTWSPSEELDAPSGCNCVLGESLGTNGTEEILNVYKQDARVYP